MNNKTMEAVGALVMNMADYEVDRDCVRRAGKLCVDYWENVKHRMISTIALATRCYQEALKQGLGTMLPFWE